MNKTQKLFVNYYVWLSPILFIIRWIISDGSFKPTVECTYNLLSYIGEAIGAAGLVMLAYNHFLWKMRWINKINQHPIMAKEYSGELLFTWNEKMDTRPVKMKIKQTYLSIKVDFSTNESISKSINAAIDYIDGDPCLIYLYRNEPDVNLRDCDISPIHYGHAKFDLSKGTDDLSGCYFTDRKTVGTIHVSAVKSSSK